MRFLMTHWAQSWNRDLEYIHPTKFLSFGQRGGPRGERGQCTDERHGESAACSVGVLPACVEHALEFLLAHALGDETDVCACACARPLHKSATRTVVCLWTLQGQIGQSNQPHQNQLSATRFSACRLHSTLTIVSLFAETLEVDAATMWASVCVRVCSQTD
jgi:hypothetical protein